jgi:hypothetical protein
MKHTTMAIQLEDKTEIERLLSLLSIGLCVAIEQGALPVQAAEDYLYSPYTIEKLQELGVSPQLMRLVHLGTELEDVESLLPEKLGESLAEMNCTALEILQALPATDRKWVQTVSAINPQKNSVHGKPTLRQPAKVYPASRP